MITAHQIAEHVSGNLIGNGTITIKGVCGITDAQKGDLSFIDNSKYVSYLKDTQASLVIVGKDCPVPEGKNVIVSENPSLAFSKALDFFMEPERIFTQGIHSMAFIHSGAKIGNNVSIGPFTVVEEGVSIADDVMIGSGCYLGVKSKIDKGTKIYPRVSVFARSCVGREVVIHSGTVIGSDGFGYVKVEEKYHKIPQLGNVIIKDNVEIGANVTIDRARFGSTIIEKDVKIDNLVQIAHNVKICEGAIIVAQVGISGSSQVGKHAILAGQVGIAGHLSIGDNAVVMAQSGVSKNVPAGEKWFGYPARNVMETNKQLVNIKKIPQLLKEIKMLEKELNKLKKNLT